MVKTPRILEYLEIIAPFIPTSIYWLDSNNVVMGGNDLAVKAVGGSSVNDFIGKTPHEYYTKEVADNIVAHTNEVMKGGESINVEEFIKDLTTGELKYSNVVISPLRDDNGIIIGTIGAAIDITDKKEAERLQAENSLQKIQLEQAEKIREITAQVAHDINSPLASLRMLMHNLQDVDEDTRIAIRNATNRITDIANNLVVKYGRTGEVEKAKANVLTPELISSLVSNILSEQRVQHRENIVFELHISDEVEGIFASVSHEHCKRMISNIINNAVEAIDKAKRKLGVVDVSIDKEEDYIVICIKDNGCGVSASILKKLGKEQVSSKGDLGHGIGLFTAIEHLRAWGGDYDIVTKKNAGTTFTIKLPITIAPSWFQKELSILTGSTIVILDDDESIHDVWNTRFRKYRNQVKIKHFSKAELMLKERFPQGTVFLIDYELFDTINGLEVIRRLQSRSMYLVTSRYEDEKIKSGCMELGVKIIPKNFAPYIPIDIYEIKDKGPNYIFIDDDVNLLRAWKIDASMNDKELEAFSSIEAFEEKKARYSKDTPIYIDYVLGVDDGVKYSKQLAKEGFNNLYLATGHDKSNFTEPMPWLRGIVGKEPPKGLSEKIELAGSCDNEIWNLWRVIYHDFVGRLAASDLELQFLNNYLPKLISNYKERNKIGKDKLELLEESVRGIKSSNSILLWNLRMYRVLFQPLSKEAFSLNRCSIKNIVELVFSSFPMEDLYGISIVLPEVEDFIFIGNEILIQHILYCLLDNALYEIKAKKNKQGVQLLTNQDKKYYYLHFRDFCGGIPAKIRAKIFMKGFSTKLGRLGIGLYFCNNAMQFMGGEITCKSNKGYTEFILRFNKI